MKKVINWQEKIEKWIYGYEGKNLIVRTLKEAGINVAKLLMREQLYRQKNLPWEVRDIIESNFVKNVRFVNALKRNIFTEKELSEEVIEKIKELNIYQVTIRHLENIYESKGFGHEYEETKRKLKELWKREELKQKWELNKLIDEKLGHEKQLREIWLKGENLAYNEITLELEAKNRKEKIERLEKEELEAQRAELNRLSQFLNEKEKKINSKLIEKENEIKKLLGQEKKNSEKLAKLEQEKSILESEKLTFTGQINQLKEKVNQLNKELNGEIRKKNWALFASTIQGFTEELMGEKWGKRANSAIQFTTGATLLRNAGEWTYEVWLMGIGVGLVFVVPRLYNMGADMLEKWAGIKLKRFNAKDKIAEKLDQLNEKAKEKAREAINVVVNMGQPQNNESQPKNLTEISSEKGEKEEQKLEKEQTKEQKKKNKG